MRFLVPCVLTVVACSAEVDPPEVTCRAGTPGDVRKVASGLVGAEGVTFSPEGRLFVSSGNRIFEVSADGTTREHAQVPHPVGLAWWGDALYVAAGDDGSGSHAGFCDAGNKGAVWKVTADGQASVFATGILAPNFLAPTPWGTLLVSDDCEHNETIWEVTSAGGVSAWSTDGVASGNGLVFDLAGANLYVASTFAKPSALWRIPVTNGAAGTPVQVAAYDNGSHADGLALDADGRVYVALNTKGAIHRVLADGTSEPFAVEVFSPASLAFGEGAFDPCSMYTTSLFGGEVLEVFVGTRGAPARR